MFFFFSFFLVFFFFCLLFSAEIKFWFLNEVSDCVNVLLEVDMADVIIEP